MKRILLILTGGTIGSKILNDGTIAPKGESQLLSLSRPRLCNDIEFEVLEPFSILSENITLKHQEDLINEIKAKCDNGFDGIIVAHGSDTLSYTSALCAMALRFIPIPLVFIASDRVLSDPLSNGIDNFLSAVQLIADNCIKRGIFVCYKNYDNENCVYLGTRLCEADPFFDSYHSFDGSCFGYISNGNFILNPNRFAPSLEEVTREKSDLFKQKIMLKNSVALLRSSPAFDYARFDVSSLSAVINYGYHSGTVNTQSFLEFAKKCYDKGVDVWLASFKDKDSPIYESLSEILSLPNVKRLYNISPEAAYARLALAYSYDINLTDKNMYYESIE